MDFDMLVLLLERCFAWLIFANIWLADNPIEITTQADLISNFTEL